MKIPKLRHCVAADHAYKIYFPADGFFPYTYHMAWLFSLALKSLLIVRSRRFWVVYRSSKYRLQ